jgi:predicted oxidoreductase
MGLQPGVQLSPVVAGLMRLPEWGLSTPALVGWIEQALDAGISSFDHADIYGGYSVEAAFGAALAAAPGLRQRLQLVSKCGIKLLHPARPGHRIKSYDSSRAHVLASVDASLQALRTDHLDLLLLHRPDLLLDAEELADTFRTLQAAGKVRAFGVSNHRPDELALLHRRFALAAHQVEVSPLQRQAFHDGSLTQCQDLGLQPMAWSPLAGGRLFQGQDDAARRVREVLDALAAQHGCTAATVAYAWLLRHPAQIRPVTGSGRPEALREAMAATTLKLAAEDWYRVWQAATGHEVA